MKAKESLWSWKAPVPASLAALEAYSAGEERAGRRLHANEMPWGEPWNRYPDPVPDALRQALAERAGVTADSVFTGNGSDEIIDLLQRAFAEPGQDAVMVCSPSFSMYAHAALLNRLPVVTVPLRPDFSFDAQAALDPDLAPTPIAFLCDPNNPTGNRLGDAELYRFLLRYPGLVVIDEAYGEFAGADHRSWMQEFPNLILLRTLSKAWGLAGLRVGYALAHPAVVQTLDRVRMPYSLAGPVRQLALRALANADLMRTRVQRVVVSRDRLVRQLESCPVVEQVYPSDANFLLLRCHPPGDTAALLERAATQAGLRIRRFGQEGPLANCLRISVGTASDNARLVAVVKNFLA
ncbi:MAG: histidinol-phosphate transaminase [Bacteroidetes bacterium]|nr:histidinol-phosphate transaminase [Bacteroidota bacterium]